MELLEKRENKISTQYFYKLRNGLVLSIVKLSYEYAALSGMYEVAIMEYNHKTRDYDVHQIEAGKEIAIGGLTWEDVESIIKNLTSGKTLNLQEAICFKQQKFHEGTKK